MKNTQQAAMTFAMSSEGRIVHVDDVANGSYCGCICPNCRTRLVAKNGGHERAHHFAHDGSVEASGCTETALHLAAKQIVADYKRLVLPRASGVLEREENPIAELNEVRLEHTLRNPLTQDWIIADCFVTHSNTEALIVEIAVLHRVDEFKAAKIRDLKFSAVEIDLSDQIGKPWTWDELENAVLFDTSRRQWIFAPHSVPISVEIPAASTLASGLREWKFAIGTTWVWVKELPYGNVKVFHRFDDQARSVVEPICRGRGYWSKGYNNWIVFDQFKFELLQLLSVEAKLL